MRFFSDKEIKSSNNIITRFWRRYIGLIIYLGLIHRRQLHATINQFIGCAAEVDTKWRLLMILSWRPCAMAHRKRHSQFVMVISLPLYKYQGTIGLRFAQQQMQRSFAGSSPNDNYTLAQPAVISGYTKLSGHEGNADCYSKDRFSPTTCSTWNHPYTNVAPNKSD